MTLHAATSTGEIDGTSKTLRTFFKSDRTFEIGFYQREYRWHTEQVEELLTDLHGRFLPAWEFRPSRRAAANDFPQYYLGTVVSAPGAGDSVALVDGQQRVTTLTLLFCALARHLDDSDPRTAEVLRSLAGEPRGGRMHPRLRATDDDTLSKDRSELIEALLDGVEDGLQIDPVPASIETMRARFMEIYDWFGVMDPAAQAGFADWLIDRVVLVEVATENMQDAYEVFEAMNDRGLRLDSLELMKGLILAHIEERSEQTLARVEWERVLDAVGRRKLKDPRNVFFRSWLRGRYAEDEGRRTGTIVPGDYKALAGDKYHRWVRANLVRKDGFNPGPFVRKDMKFAADRFIELVGASTTPTDELPNAQYVVDTKPSSAPIAYMMLMSVVDAGDDAATALRKMRLMAHYLDTFVARRIAAGRPLGDQVTWPIFLALAKQVRGLPLAELARTLHAHAEAMAKDPKMSLSGLASLSYDDETKDRVRWMLARLTHAVELGCRTSRDTGFRTLVNGQKFHIEHLLPAAWDPAASPYDNEDDHALNRSLLGGLVLLPAKVNMSIQDEAYATKVPKYSTVTSPALTQTLCPGFGSSDPEFAAFLKASGLSFATRAALTTTSIQERGAEYVALAKYIWDFGRLADDVIGNSDWRALDSSADELPAASSDEDDTFEATDQE